MHYLLFYEFVPDYLHRRGQYRDEHLRHAWAAEERGELLLAGAFADNLPMLFFATPRMYTAHSPRLTGVVPSVMRPPILWNADMLGVTGSK